MVSPEEYLANKNKTSISPKIIWKQTKIISPEEYLSQKNQNPVTKANSKGTGLWGWGIGKECVRGVKGRDRDCRTPHGRGLI